MSDATESGPPARYDDLRALFLNCTLKRSPRRSHTRGLIDASAALMRDRGVAVEILRPVDHSIAFGVQPDMTADDEYGWTEDGWPPIREKVLAADILVIGTPIWLGERSSVCSMVMERLYASSAERNDRGQYIYYGRVGGCVVTGNEDGAKHCATSILYGLSHLGYTIPPQADAGWLGKVGPGPSYLDPEADGPETEFTNRNATFMTWNLLHLARMLKDAGGLPAYGNDAAAWDDGERFGFEHPHRDD